MIPLPFLALGFLLALALVIFLLSKEPEPVEPPERIPQGLVADLLRKELGRLEAMRTDK